jgi:hypothetical protein
MSLAGKNLSHDLGSGWVIGVGGVFKKLGFALGLDTVTKWG